MLSLYPRKEGGRKIILPENANDLSGSVQTIYVENHAEECVKLCVGQRLGTVHSMCLDKEASIRAALWGSTVNQEAVNSEQESDFPTEESKRKFTRESLKIDDNKILNQDEVLKEEVVKLFLENFSTLALHPNHYGKTELLELQIELEPGAGEIQSKAFISRSES